LFVYGIRPYLHIKNFCFSLFCTLPCLPYFRVVYLTELELNNKRNSVAHSRNSIMFLLLLLTLQPLKAHSESITSGCLKATAFAIICTLTASILTDKLSKKSGAENPDARPTCTQMFTQWGTMTFISGLSVIFTTATLGTTYRHKPIILHSAWSIGCVAAIATAKLFNYYVAPVPVGFAFVGSMFGPLLAIMDHLSETPIIKITHKN